EVARRQGYPSTRSYGFPISGASSILVLRRGRHPDSPEQALAQGVPHELEQPLVGRSPLVDDQDLRHGVCAVLVLLVEHGPVGDEGRDSIAETLVACFLVNQLQREVAI